MNVYGPAIVRHSADKKSFLISVPRYLCELLNCTPRNGIPEHVWVHLLDLSGMKAEYLTNIMNDAEEELSKYRDQYVPEASKLQLLVSPYPTRSERGTAPVHVHALMKDVPYALYCLSWLLGDVFRLDMTYSYGIDAVDNFGALDAILESPDTKNKAIPAQDLEKRINKLLKKISEWEGCGREAFTEFFWEEYRKLNFVNRYNRSEKERIQQAINNLFMQVLKPALNEGKLTGAGDEATLKSILVPPNLFPHSFEGDPPRVLLEADDAEADLFDILTYPKLRVRVKPIFPQKISSLINKDPLKVKIEPRANLEPEDVFWISIPKNIDGADVSDLYKTYFPSDEQEYSYAVVGLNEGAGSLGIHLKPVYEELIDISLRLRGKLAEAGGLARLTERMSGANWDFRIAAHRVVSDNSKDDGFESLRVIADVSRCPLDMFHNNQLLAEAVRHILGDVSDGDGTFDIEARWACDCPPVHPYLNVVCACSRKPSEEACQKLQSRFCRSAEGKVSQSGSFNVGEFISDDHNKKESIFAICLKMGDDGVNRQIVLETTPRDLAKSRLEVSNEARRLATRDEFKNKSMFRAPLGAIALQAACVLPNEEECALEDAVPRVRRNLCKDQVFLVKREREKGNFELSAEENYPFKIANIDSSDFSIKVPVDGSRLAGGENGDLWGVLLEPADCEVVSNKHLKGKALLVWIRENLHLCKGADTKQDCSVPLVLKLALSHAVAENAQVELGLPTAVTPPCLWVYSMDIGQGLLMPYLNGDNLEKRFSPSEGYVSLQDIKQVLIEIANGIEELWKASCVNIDIKPANVFITSGQDSRTFLIDMGLCYKANSEDNVVPGTTYQQHVKDGLYVFGSPYHIPPEIRKGAAGGGSFEPLDDRTMLYQWAAIACALFGDPGFARGLVHHSEGYEDNGTPMTWNEAFTKKMEDVSLKYLRTNPQDQYTEIKPQVPEGLKVFSEPLAEIVNKCLHQPAEAEDQIRAIGFASKIKSALSGG